MASGCHSEEFARSEGGNNSTVTRIRRDAARRDRSLASWQKAGRCLTFDNWQSSGVGIVSRFDDVNQYHGAAAAPAVKTSRPEVF